ncbi:MAG: hypothetical protein IJ300_01290 [Clostridia bacterium]|nr:hypothetical protein [Clostridia bacterium]
MEERFETFTVLMNRINRNIRKIKNSEMSEYKLRSPHISCLYYLFTSNGLTATDLCEKCEEDKATISRSLAYLEKNGYLLCNCNNVKRYNSTFTLTKKGYEAGRKIALKIDEVLREVSVGLSDNERTEFYRCLSIISGNIDRITGSAYKSDI